MEQAQTPAQFRLPALGIDRDCGFEFSSRVLESALPFETKTQIIVRRSMVGFSRGRLFVARRSFIPLVLLEPQVTETGIDFGWMVAVRCGALQLLDGVILEPALRRKLDCLGQRARMDWTFLHRRIVNNVSAHQVAR